MRTQAGNLHTVRDAARQLGMGRSTLYRHIKANRVPYRIMPGGQIRLADADIDAILDAAHRPAAA